MKVWTQNQDLFKFKISQLIDQNLKKKDTKLKDIKEVLLKNV